jgi:hypothetical protein
MAAIIDYLVFAILLLVGAVAFILLRRNRKKNVIAHSINPDPPIDQFFRSLDDLT